MDESTEMSGVFVVILARMSSCRLPGKVLLPLGGSTVLEQVLRRIRTSGVGERVVVAVPDGEADRPLRRFCEAKDIPYEVGSEQDVIGRLLGVARRSSARCIVRCQASHPLLDPRMLWASVRHALDTGMDLVTVAGLPRGTACEAMPATTLRRVQQVRSHIPTEVRTACLFETLTTPFERALLPAPPRLFRPDLRLTLETEEDFRFMKRLYTEVPLGVDGTPALEDVIHHIDRDRGLLMHSTDGIAVVRTN